LDFFSLTTALTSFGFTTLAGFGFTTLAGFGFTTLAGLAFSLLAALNAANVYPAAFFANNVEDCIWKYY
jgi:hypothetical protein